jgi:ABC-type microcin C transport system permease subunit YejB
LCIQIEFLIIQMKAGLAVNQRLAIAKQANGFIMIGAQIFLRHAAKEKNIHYVNKKYRDCFQMQSDMIVEQKAEIDCKYNKALN